ncbi:RecX family transcriptional regulator [Dokdonia sinensis]|uniref:Regulatory protein RecX n=1 Tax=Dokdonia sinensis TaxID=2479847 RepID=A0A3M0FWU7_9FLAO|nr:regulatory protein RecX [Dokdonia sinensis]RMB56447.1 RecX family transcriptional regulator [Dokdonia sinensis]
MQQPKPTKTFTIEEAKRSIERYCAYQERCHQEVGQKLREMRMIPVAIDEIIAHLIEHNFLNETRFAQAFARGKFRHKQWGRVRITRELKARKISTYNIKLALKELEDDAYFETFDTLSRKRYEQLSTETDKYKKRKKIADYLLYRGWESHLVYDRVKELVP